MVQAIVYDKDRALREGIAGAGSALAGALQQRAMRTQEEEKRQQLRQEQQEEQQRYGTILSETLSDIPEGASPMQIVGKMSDMLNQGVPLEYLKGIMPLIEPQLKGSIQGEQQRSFLEYMGFAPPQGPESEIPQQGQFDPQGMPQQPQMAPIPGQPQQPMAPQQQPLQPVSPQQQMQSVFERANDDQLIAMQASGIPQISQGAKAEQDRRNADRKAFREDRDFAYKRAGKYLEKVDESRKTVGDQSEALNLMENAIREGNTEFWSADNFANFLGRYGEGLRTAKGAQLLNAQKEFLVSDIGRVGNRPNMWIEQQISGALTKIGRSDEANLTVVEALRARNERDKKRIEVTDALEQQYMKPPAEGGLGYVPGNIAALVDEAMKPYNEAAGKKLAYKLRQIQERESSGSFKELMKKKVTPGTPLTLEMASMFVEKYKTPEKARENAKKLGYYIPEPEEYRSYLDARYF